MHFREQLRKAAGREAARKLDAACAVFVPVVISGMSLAHVVSEGQAGVEEWSELWLNASALASLGKKKSQFLEQSAKCAVVLWKNLDLRCRSTKIT